jgi:hypothetical protein
VCFSVFAEERKFEANNPINANSFQKNNLVAGTIQILLIVSKYLDVMKNKAQFASKCGSVVCLRDQAGCELERSASRMLILAFDRAIL